jgi:hypothetical protein
MRILHRFLIFSIPFFMGLVTLSKAIPALGVIGCFAGVLGGMKPTPGYRLRVPEKAGAVCIVIPCNTAHDRFPRIKQNSV